MSDIAIAVEHLVVVRGHHAVLDDITVTVPTGQVTGLLGPSGSGKTTLMRSIMGVQRIRSGTVTVLGRPAGTPALRSLVSYVTQAPSVYRDLTVAQNVNYFAALQGKTKRAAGVAIKDVGLDSYSDNLVGALSGGQQSRVSLACAIVGDPQLIVLDEPTVGLDPVLREELWARFHAMAAAGITLLVSSHVMDEASRCAQLLLIRDGALIANDTPAAIRTRTGEPDLEQAFLRLIRDESAGAAA
jgi:ABC-2 type transport system ATP-binding protein